MKAFLLTLLAVSACTSEDAPIEMPTTPVACGGGAAGEILGSVNGAPFVAKPSWAPQSGERPSVLLIAPRDPSLLFYLKYTTQPPPVGAQPNASTHVNVDGTDLQSLDGHVVIDESDATQPVCVAGRFEVTIDNHPLAGWFRTR